MSSLASIIFIISYLNWLLLNQLQKWTKLVYKAFIGSNQYWTWAHSLTWSWFGNEPKILKGFSFLAVCQILHHQTFCVSVTDLCHLTFLLWILLLLYTSFPDATLPLLIIPNNVYTERLLLFQELFENYCNYPERRSLEGHPHNLDLKVAFESTVNT